METILIEEQNVDQPIEELEIENDKMESNKNENWQPNKQEVEFHLRIIAMLPKSEPGHFIGNEYFCG